MRRKKARPTRILNPGGRVRNVQLLEETPHPFIGLDLGQKQDYTAISVLEVYPVRRIIHEGGRVRTEETVLYHARRLERYLDTPYTAIVERVVDLIMKLGGERRVFLNVDIVGVGQMAKDYITTTYRERAQESKATGGPNVVLKPGWIYTTNGGTVNYDNKSRQLNVPRRELVYATLLAMEDGRFEASKSKNLDVLQTELRNLAVKQNPKTGHESFEHYRESDHDDLATAVMLPIFAAERFLVPGVRARYRIKPQNRPMVTEDSLPGVRAPEPEGYTAITGAPVPPRV